MIISIVKFLNYTDTDKLRIQVDKKIYNTYSIGMQ